MVDSHAYLSVHGEENTQSFFGRKPKRLYYIGTTWDESPSSFEVELIRTVHNPYTPSELRSLEKWLFSQTAYKKFYIDPDDDTDGLTSETINGEVKRLYVNCKFTNPTKLMFDGGVMGFSCTMECDSGWVLQDAITYAPELDGDSNTVTITVDSDVPDYIYPRVVITSGSSGGDIYIINQTDDSYRTTSLKDVSPNSVIIMNSAINYITPEYYDYFPNHNFIRLVDGENTLTIEGDVSAITFTWSNMRYW